MNKIVVVKIRNLEDLYVIEEVLELYEYYKAKNIVINIVIVNGEKNVYEQYLKEGIVTLILNKQLSVNKGVYIIDDNRESVIL